jgi:hypothetical protein
MLARATVGLAATFLLACGGTVSALSTDAGGDDSSAESEGGVWSPPTDGGSPDAGEAGVDAAPEAAPEASVPLDAATVLAQLKGEPHDLQVDPSGVYLTAWDPPSSPAQDILYRVPPGGGAPEKLVEDFWLFQMALDADAVYVTAGSKVFWGNERILRIAKSDGSEQQLTTPCDKGRMLGPIAVDATSVYFGCRDGYACPDGLPDTCLPSQLVYFGGFIGRMPKTGGPVEILVPEIWQPSSIVVVGDTMYLAEELTGSVRSCPIASCSAGLTAIAPWQWHPRGLSLAGSSLVWAAGLGTDHTFAWSIATGGGAPEQLGAIDWVDRFDADESGIYWNSGAGSSARLWHAPLDGSASVAIQSPGRSVGPIALTSDAVYHAPYDDHSWAIQVWRLPKP